MQKASIQELLAKKIQKTCKPYTDKLQNEKDEVKRLKLTLEIRKRSFEIILDLLKDLSEPEWERFTEEIFEPVVKELTQVSAQLDTIALRTASSLEEIKKREKLKTLISRANDDNLEILEKANLNKKQLERYIILLLNDILRNELSSLKNGIDFFEFSEAITTVQKRLGLTHHWLTYIALIQLHENLIKKKVTELDGKVEKEGEIYVLMNRLSQLIKEKEERDVALDLLMSHGLKKTRDTMTHEGYRQPVVKKDLERIHGEIVALEQTLWPNT